MKVALVGQPNSGKSTVFNAVAGYRSLTSNFAGTTVEYTRGHTRLDGELLELIDLPGLYSLTPTTAVEQVSRDYLLGGDWDVIVNVLDASQMARSLELTLELLDLESPLVVCLNMMDEAARKGMTIDRQALEAALGVPVVEAIGARGRGIVETFRTARQLVASGKRPRAFVYAPEVESVIESLAGKMEGRRQEIEVRSEELGVRRQETGDRRQELGDRSQELEDRSLESGVRNQEREDRRGHSGDFVEQSGRLVQIAASGVRPGNGDGSGARPQNGDGLVARPENGDGSGARGQNGGGLGVRPGNGDGIGLRPGESRGGRPTFAAAKAAASRPHSKALDAHCCAGCASGCADHHAAEGAQRGVMAAVLELAADPTNGSPLTVSADKASLPVAADETSLPFAASPSEVAHPSLPRPFPPARFRALQLVQSNPGTGERRQESGDRSQSRGVRSEETGTSGRGTLHLEPRNSDREPGTSNPEPRASGLGDGISHSGPASGFLPPTPNAKHRFADIGRGISHLASATSDGQGTPVSYLLSPDSFLPSPDSSLGPRTSDFGLSFDARSEIALRTGLPADAAISAARHAACLNLFERVAHIARPKADWREWVDHLAMHPVWGYVILAGVFLGFFRLIFNVGQLGEDRIVNVFDAIVAAMARHMNAQGALFAAAKGAVLGTAGAVAIVLPYLLPFLVGLAILEDIGYLSRVGYLMDAAMHRMGLHGTATLPVLVGYGCSVPAVMATRILSTRRDRFIAAFLAVLVPCSARMTVIFALVGFYLGPNYALGIYALNVVVVALAGHVLARLWPEVSPGMLMEVPAYRVPGWRVVALKTWWRLREFVLVAFPLLVVGSVVLSLVDFYGWQHGINALLSPLTALLGLPRSVGLTLIFGVLRKELSLLMLMQALGTTHVLGAMTAAQILIFTLFVTFYLPCMATLASMMRELGWRLTLAASGALLALAVVVSLAARGVLAVL